MPWFVMKLEYKILTVDILSHHYQPLFPRPDFLLENQVLGKVAGPGKLIMMGHM